MLYKERDFDFTHLLTDCVNTTTLYCSLDHIPSKVWNYSARNDPTFDETTFPDRLDSGECSFVSSNVLTRLDRYSELLVSLFLAGMTLTGPGLTG